MTTIATKHDSPLARLREETADAIEPVARRIRGDGDATPAVAEPKSKLEPERTIAGTLLGRVEDLWPSELPSLRFPAIDVENKEDEVVVTADVPGYGEQDLDVEATASRLTIRGRTSKETEHRGKGVRQRSISSGSFVRTIELPAEVRTAKVTAAYRDGVLTVKLPKTAEARARHVRVTVGEADPWKHGS